MNALETAQLLGYKKIIWIDDHFNITAKDIAELIINNFETSSKYSFTDHRINEVLNQYSIFKEADVDEVFLDNCRNDLEEYLVSKSLNDLKNIKNIVLEQETIKNDEHRRELSERVINQVCDYLNIDENCRLNFNDAYKIISKISNDHDTLYMIDLSEGDINPERGLEVLLHLIRNNSKGTAFILTHNVTIHTEDQYQKEYSERDDFRNNIIFSVIAKEKLYDEELLDHSLKAALKKVTLRKNLVSILDNLEECMKNTYLDTKLKLLELKPEDIEKYIHRKGEIEGVSELHVIERAILSNTKFNIRNFFNSAQHQFFLEKLRHLKYIPIDSSDNLKIHPNLEYFRNLECYNNKEMINKNFTHLNCGDIFEIKLSDDNLEKFILLAQPCDISIRGEDGNRVLKEALLAPLKVKDIKLNKPELKDIELPKFIKSNNEGTSELYNSYKSIHGALKRSRQQSEKFFNDLNKALKKIYEFENKNVALKEMKLDFLIDGIQYYVNFSNAVNINLSILDLVSFNQDGTLSFDSLQKDNFQFTVALQKKFNINKINFAQHFAELKSRKGNNRKFYLESNKKLQLSLFLDITPKFTNKNKIMSLSWPIQRIGNIAEPYASEILKKYMYVMSRTAYELDYTT